MINKEDTYFNLGISNQQDQTMKNYFSMFPEDLLGSILDSFIINKPMAGKVGGDGFWVYQSEEELYIALFDCMGHGHLASMMTRVYTSALQAVVKDEEVTNPGTILRFIHHKIAAKFKKKDNLQVGSAADVGLLKINIPNRKIEYSGARTELIHIHNGQMDTIKGDKMPIGDFFDYDHNYNTVQVPLEEGVPSNFYLASDGFKDLMGGPENKKLGKKAVNEIYLENSGQPMITQKELITAVIGNWQGSSMQLDDTLIIGVSV